MKKTKILVYMSLFVAMYVVLTYLIPVIKIDIIRISFGFVPQAFASMLFGPLIGGVGSAAGDILGMLIAPSGAYFAGFTLSAFLAGMIYGLFLYNKPKTLLRIILAVLCITIFIDIGLNTYWLTILLGKGYMALLPARVIKSAAMLPVQIIVISLLWKYAGRHMEGISGEAGRRRV